MRPDDVSTSISPSLSVIVAVLSCFKNGNSNVTDFSEN